MADEISLQELIGTRSKLSMSDQLYQQISELILSGKLQEGYTFPNENALCEQLQVGRNTLREAYKALELSGFVTRTKRGTSVNSRTTILNATPLSSIFRMANPENFREFRCFLETECAQLAAVHANLSDVTELEEIVRQSQFALDEKDIEKLKTLDAEFHMKISDCSKNSLFTALSSVIMDAWQANVAYNFVYAMEKDNSILHDIVPQHAAIVEAIRLRDSDKAAAAMKTHLNRVIAR